MKDKILVFIIGLLIGAVITASGFLIHAKTHKNAHQMPSRERMQMMQRPDGETPPEKPNGMQNDSNRLEPPSNSDSSSNNQKS